ncbi:MAG TPA: molybdenum cofactor biosynthesis protein B [Lacipirellula sp.]
MDRHQSPTPGEHRQNAPQRVVCAVVTVSDTRTLADDKSGATIVELLEGAGHAVAARTIVPDEPDELDMAIRELVVHPSVAVILITGGTGIAPRDQTPDAVGRLFTRELPGFGELFRMLSFEEIGAAAMLSRATAGMIDRTAVFLMPGSTAAVRLAMQRLIIPELGHLAKLAAKESGR